MSCMLIDSAKLDVMNFLNEISSKYPDAISFASGRPTESSFNTKAWIENIDLFVKYGAEKSSISKDEYLMQIAQYGKTTGIINELILKQVEIDEAIKADEKNIIVTSGCQEALFLCLKTLCKEKDDVLIMMDPTYTGVIGLSIINNITVKSTPNISEERFIEKLEMSIYEVIKTKMKPRAIYLIPNFDNPMGVSLSFKDRIQLIELCKLYDIKIIEDNPYGMFSFDEHQFPPLYELDRYGSVYYLGTYSKTICPSMRVGFILLPKTVHGVKNTIDLKNEISTIKSYITLNTSQIMQAAVGGTLIREKYTLKNMIRKARDRYRENRDAIEDELTNYFSSIEGISWNHANGGFFITVKFPCEFTVDDVKACAKNNGVIFMPLSFFSTSKKYDKMIRLSFSNLSTDAIHMGVQGLASYIKQKLNYRYY